MKKITLFSFFIFSLIAVNAQSWQWAKRFGSNSNSNANDRFYGMITDNAGNIYSCGGYQAGTTFGSIALTDYGGLYDIFIAKYDCQGNLLWVNTAGSSGLDGATALDVDNNGNVYVSGFCSADAANPLYFGDSTITAITSDFFLAKYDATGNFIWLQVAVPGVSYLGTNSTGVDILPNGNILIAGDCPTLPGGGAIFPGFNVSIGKFFAEFTPAGTIVNVFNYSPTTTLNKAKGTVKTDALNNRYIAGYFTANSVTIATQTLNRIGFEDGYIAKFNSANSLIWLYQIGHINESFALSGFDVDPNGNTWIAGTCTDTAHIGTFTLINSLSANAGMAFVAKINSSGSPVFADKISSTFGSVAESIASFGDSAVFTGNFRGSALCGTTSLTATNAQDIYIATVKSGVGFINAISISGSGSNNENGWRIVVDNNRNKILNGIFESSITIGSTTLTSSGGSYEGFIAKYGGPLCTTGIAESYGNGHLQLNIFPNPANKLLSVSIKENGLNKVSIINALGEIVLKEQIVVNHQEQIHLNISSLSPGIYVVQATGKNNSSTAKFIKE
jgi:hypothetical protein